MSLAEILRRAEVRTRVDLVRPPSPRFEAATAPPVCVAAPLAATAVANGIRLELARRHPLERGIWPAEDAPARLAILAPERVDEAEAVIARALAFVKRSKEGASEAATAALALQLARLENVVRAGYVDARIGFDEAAEDVAEVAGLLALVPWQDVGAPTLPPPVFPDFADAFPDAEPDGFAGGTMFAVSASRAPKVDADDVRLLILRLVLARKEWGTDAAAQRLESLGVLLARHGILWRIPAATLVAHEAFPAFEASIRDQVEAALAAQDSADAPGRRARSKAPGWVKKRFGPKPSGTHPEGKAEKKKRTKETRAESPQRGPSQTRASKRNTAGSGAKARFSASRSKRPFRPRD